MDGSGFGELRPRHSWSSVFGYHHTIQPDRHRSDVQRLDDKVYAGHLRRNGSSIWNAGTIGGADPAITVPGSVTVPANGSTTLTVTVSAAQGTTVQGWVILMVARTTCISRITPKSLRKNR